MTVKIIKDLYDESEVKSVLDDELYSFLSDRKYPICNVYKNIISLLCITGTICGILLFKNAVRLDIHKQLMIQLICVFFVVYVIYRLIEKFLIRGNLIRINGKFKGIHELRFDVHTDMETTPLYKYIVEKRGFNGTVKKTGMSVGKMFWENGKFNRKVFIENLEKFIDK